MDEYFDTWAMFKDATAGTWTDQNGKSIDESDKQSNLANYFLIGMTSYHEDQTEDRSFKFFYAYSPHYELQNCEWEEYTTYENAFEFEFGRCLHFDICSIKIFQIFLFWYRRGEGDKFHK